MSDALIANEVDVSKVTYGTTFTTDNGVKFIRVNYKRGPLKVQTPDMYAPFGINISKFENGKHALDLSFRDIDECPELQDLKDMFSRLDNKLIDDAFSGVLPSHNKKFTSRDVVDILLRPVVKCKDEKYPANFKVTLPTDSEGKYTFPTFLIDPKTDDVVKDPETGKPAKVDLSTLNTKHATCSVIMQCNGVCVTGGSNFGCTWKVTQLRIKPSQTVPRDEYAFKDVGRMLDPSFEQDLEDENDMQDGDEARAAKALAMNDEEEEEDADDDPMEAPVKAPPPVAAKAAPAPAKKAIARK